MTEPNKPFRGFPRETLAFLSELSANNRKSWFEAHRGVYDSAVVQPSLAFVEAMGVALKAMAPSVRPEPRVGGSMFRIHRDVRFSTDKRPYKTHVGLRFRDGDTSVSAKCTGPLFYVEFDAERLLLGVGVKAFDPVTLGAYRRAVLDEDVAAELSRTLRDARRKGHAVMGEVLARAPHGYAAQPDDELPKRKGLFVAMETRLPKEIGDAGFVQYCAKRFRPYVPLFERLRRIAFDSLG